MARRKLVVGNWKMNGWREDLNEIGLIAGAAASHESEIVLCVPATLIEDAATISQGTPLKIGGQNCHARASGAHTGEIAAGMLADAGASHVILGHSERRSEFGESSADVRAKVEAAAHGGLVAIACIGENAGERDAGRAVAVVREQLEASVPDWTKPENLVIAYEPVWAIGTGRTPTPKDIGAVMSALREGLEKHFGEEQAGEFRLLYGGSVSAANAAQIFAVEGVDGALVGSASLKAEDFLPIIEAAG